MDRRKLFDNHDFSIWKNYAHEAVVEFFKPLTEMRMWNFLVKTADQLNSEKKDHESAILFWFF